MFLHTHHIHCYCSTERHSPRLQPDSTNAYTVQFSSCKPNILQHLLSRASILTAFEKRCVCKRITCTLKVSSRTSTGSRTLRVSVSPFTYLGTLWVDYTTADITYRDRATCSAIVVLTVNSSRGLILEFSTRRDCCSSVTVYFTQDDFISEDGYPSLRKDLVNQLNSSLRSVSDR